MKRFIMRWPSLDMEVRCECLPENEQAFDLFVANMPIKALQGHEMVGGWLLHDHAIQFKAAPFTLTKKEMKTEHMDKAPVGRVSLLQPQERCGELLVKYDDSVDNREYVPVAQVIPEDIETLKKAGKQQWVATSRTKDVIIVEFIQEA